MTERSWQLALAVACAATLILSGASLAQNPIDRKVTDDDLTSKYKRGNKSDNATNIEYKIDVPVGKADSAIGTIFSRAESSYKITQQELADEATYDDIKSAQFLRYIYVANQARNRCDTYYDGPEVFVAVDYRRAEPEDIYYEAYIAEVEKEMETDLRWKFKKVTP